MQNSFQKYYSYTSEIFGFKFIVIIISNKGNIATKTHRLLGEKEIEQNLVNNKKKKNQEDSDWRRIYILEDCWWQENMKPEENSTGEKSEKSKLLE